MNYRVLEKQIKLYNQIKDLDKQIISVEKIAISLVNDEIIPIDFALKFNNENQKNTDTESEINQALGGSDIRQIQQRLYSRMFGIVEMSSEVKNDDTETLSGVLSIELSFSLLAVILDTLKKSRKDLIQKLEGLV